MYTVGTEEDHTIYNISDFEFQDHRLTRRWPKVKIHLRTPRGGVGTTPLDFGLPVRIFRKYFSWVCFRGQGNPTVIMKKFHLYCMTLKIKVKHLFA